MVEAQVAQAGPTLKGPDGTATLVNGNPSRRRVAVDGRMLRQYDSDECIVKNELGFMQIVDKDEALSLQLSGKWEVCRPDEPVLIQNKKNSYTFARAKDVVMGVRENKMVILQPADEEYIRAVKLALGVDPDGQIKKGEVIQRFGQCVIAADIGAYNAEATIEAAEQLVKNLEANKDSGLITENLPDPATFEGKVRASMRGKRAMSRIRKA